VADSLDTFRSPVLESLSILTEEATSAPPDAESPPEPPAKKSGSSTSDYAQRGLLGFSGLLLLLGFFLPWVTIGDVANISGLELVIHDNLPSWQRVMLGFCPLVSLVLMAVAGFGVKGARWFGVGAGGCVLGYGLFTIAYIVFNMIDVGIWMVMGGGIIAMVTGLAFRPRKARAKKTASGPAPEPPPDVASA
jgi:hypothetical protein